MRFYCDVSVKRRSLVKELRPSRNIIKMKIVALSAAIGRRG